MPYVETLSPQTVFVINAVVLRSTELDYFSIVIPSDGDPASRVIKMATSSWKSCVKDETKSSQSDKVRIFTVTPDAARFRQYVSQWRKERNTLSSSAWDDASSPAYRKIIGMGQKAIPFILNEMRYELKTGDPDDWFVALWSITDENPVPPDSRGNLKEMAAAWLEWGLRQGHIDGEGVGTGISAVGYLRGS